MKTAPGARVVGRDTAWTEFSSLPRETQKEVLDFIAFVRARRTAPRAPKAAAKRPKLAAEAFVGMWRGRSDMSDSTSWVRRAREEEWVKRRG